MKCIRKLELVFRPRPCTIRVHSFTRLVNTTRLSDQDLTPGACQLLHAAAHMRLTKRSSVKLYMYGEATRTGNREAAREGSHSLGRRCRTPRARQERLPAPTDASLVWSASPMTELEEV